MILKVLIGSLKLKADRFKASQSIEMMAMSLNVRALGSETDLSQSFYALSGKVYKSCKLRFVQVKPDRAIKLVEEQKSTSTSVKDSKRGNLITNSLSSETTSPFTSQTSQSHF